MDQNLKERLVGASVLIILAVIFIPMFLSDVPITDEHITETNIPEKPGEFSSRIVPLEMSDKLSVDATTPTIETEITTDNSLITPTREIEPVVTEEPQETTVTEVIKENSNGVGLTAWVVQLGSFTAEENAQSLNKQLRELKYPSFVEPLVREDSVVYRVRVGPELRRSNAEKLKSEIYKKVGVEGILVQYP